MTVGPAESAPLRIFRMCERLPPEPGGKEIHVEKLTREQVAAGHDVLVVFRAGEPTGYLSLRISIPRILRSLGGAKRSLVFSTMAALELRRRSADVVHIHGSFVEALPFVMMRRFRLTSAALVLTVHGGLNPRYQRVSAPIYRMLDRVICLGSHPADQVRSMGVREQRLVVMSSGVDLTTLKAFERRSRAHGTTFTVGTVGSLIPLKNVIVILKAFMSIADASLRLVVIGDGPERPNLELAATGDNRVRFTGHMASSNLYREVADLDCFVLASLRTKSKAEGVSTALLEAVALGVPAIVSDQALPEPVLPREAYLVFDPSSPSELARCITDLRDNPSLGDDLVSKSRAEMTKLDWPTRAAQASDVLMQANREAHERAVSR